MSSKLTAKQEMFCKEYMIDLNATQAAIRAGYSKKTANRIASQNLSKPEIQEYIQQQMDKRSERTEITADYVLHGIKEVVERCTQAEPVVIDGVETGEYRFEHNGALKGYELLGKHLKLFSDKIDVNNRYVDKAGEDLHKRDHEILARMGIDV